MTKIGYLVGTGCKVGSSVSDPAAYSTVALTLEPDPFDETFAAFPSAFPPFAVTSSDVHQARAESPCEEAGH